MYFSRDIRPGCLDILDMRIYLQKSSKNIFIILQIPNRSIQATTKVSFHSWKWPKSIGELMLPAKLESDWAPTSNTRALYLSRYWFGVSGRFSWRKPSPQLCSSPTTPIFGTFCGQNFPISTTSTPCCTRVQSTWSWRARVNYIDCRSFLYLGNLISSKCQLYSAWSKPCLSRLTSSCAFWWL